MKRCAVYAHFDEAGEIKPYVLFCIRALASVCESIVFVSTASLGKSELDKVAGLVSHVECKENIGYDFAMWQSALAKLDLRELDELVLINSSVFGPVFPLNQIFDEMADVACDFWGMTESRKLNWHLQSYFLCFRKNLLQSPHLHAYFSHVLSFKNKNAVIYGYELSLGIYLFEQGFQPAAYSSSPKLCDPARKPRGSQETLDATLFRPAELLDVGMPFVKVSLFRNNPVGVRLDRVWALLEQHAFDTRLVPKHEPKWIPGEYQRNLRRSVAAWLLKNRVLRGARAT